MNEEFGQKVRERDKIGGALRAKGRIKECQWIITVIIVEIRWRSLWVSAWVRCLSFTYMWRCKLLTRAVFIRGQTEIINTLATVHQIDVLEILIDEVVVRHQWVVLCWWGASKGLWKLNVSELNWRNRRRKCLLRAAKFLTEKFWKRRVNGVQGKN